MAVLGLMALLMGLVLPSLLRSWEREKNRAALRELTATLRSRQERGGHQGTEGAAVSEPQDRPLSAGRIRPGKEP